MTFYRDRSMKFVKEIPKVNFDFKNNDKWLKSRKLLSTSSQIVVGVLVGIALMEILALCYSTFFFNGDYHFAVYRRLYIFVLAIIIHELIHLAAFPKPSRAIVGIVPKNFLFFVSPTKLTTGCRMVVIYLLPFLILTIVPTVMLSVLNNPSIYLADLALYNALGSGLDIVYVGTILFNPYPLKSIYATNNRYLFVYKRSIKS